MSLLIIYDRKLKDLKFGNYYEQKVIKWFNENDYSLNKLQFYKNPYNVMDMCNSNNIIELKTRRIHHNSYPDMMIGLNKIQEAVKNKDPNVLYTMTFLCKDGLYGWTYEKGKPYDVRMGGRTDRGKDERKMCAYLPTKDLFLITTEINSIS